MHNAHAHCTYVHKNLSEWSFSEFFGGTFHMAKKKVTNRQLKVNLYILRKT